MKRKCVKCLKEFEHTGQNQKYCLCCKESVSKIYHADYALKTRRTPEGRKSHNRRAKRYRLVHPELISVINHYQYIFKRTDSRSRCYKGMPFYDGWNPDKGGSLKLGEEWIIRNIGKRPDGHSLHIVEQEVGFMPGNLEWASPKKQSSQKMFKIITQLKRQIYQLELELKKLREND